ADQRHAPACAEERKSRRAANPGARTSDQDALHAIPPQLVSIATRLAIFARLAPLIKVAWPKDCPYHECDPLTRRAFVTDKMVKSAVRVLDIFEVFEAERRALTISELVDLL